MTLLVNLKAYILPFSLFLLLAMASSLVFGFTHEPTWDDASQYNAYAINLVEGSGYSLDGGVFSNLREPGYPIFLSLVYVFFGNENITAVTLVQTFLLALCGLAFFSMFIRSGFSKRYGVVVGSVVSIFPIYGYYTHEVGTEILFLFLMSILALLAHVLYEQYRAHARLQYKWLILFGIISGYATLVRVQFLFFLPIVALLFLLFVRQKLVAKYVFASLFSFATIVGTWMLVVYGHTGNFSITAGGRAESVLHARAVRSELSYPELGQYLVAWIFERGGESVGQMNPLLQRADLVGVTPLYRERASTTEAMNEIKREDIQTLMSNPVKYLTGNLVEIVKLYYLEYLYTEHFGRFARLFTYLLLYASVLFGTVALWRKWKNLEKSVLALVCIFFSLVVYNTLILSFFDTIPRYNTPFLGFFIAFGIIGFALLDTRRFQG